LTPLGPILVVLEVFYSITDPPILFVLRIVPPLRLGSIALDTSFLIVLGSGSWSGSSSSAEPHTPGCVSV
jgi:hypothetical protein